MGTAIPVIPPRWILAAGFLLADPPPTSSPPQAPPLPPSLHLERVPRQYRSRRRVLHIRSRHCRAQVDETRPDLMRRLHKRACLHLFVEPRQLVLLRHHEHYFSWRRCWMSLWRFWTGRFTGSVCKTQSSRKSNAQNIQVKKSIARNAQPCAGQHVEVSLQRFGLRCAAPQHLVRGFMALRRPRTSCTCT